MRRNDTSPAGRPGVPGIAPRLPWRAMNVTIGGVLLLACLAIWLNAAARPHALDLPGGVRIAVQDAPPGTTLLTYVPARIDETGLDGYAAALCGSGRYDMQSIRPTWTDRLQHRARVQLTCQ
ncbi:hypothetical protein [Maliponia aquimaris]|uniref:Uncharacterized protein n=1 Tax=Maliponia aquimaris TaxID=1673631 RepID=A0A238KWR8_9RHOB|nr:hypothetical protein [Maliponia aquimaris]SMX47229.1 hypothetical protein MAA8898_03606 [Maliponia aquimaris]